MKKDDVKIQTPCDEQWKHMSGDHQKRHCDACRKDVLNISMMSEAEASTLLEGVTTTTCLRYTYNDHDEIMFADTADPSWRLHAQRQGLNMLVSATALAMPLLLAGCQSELQEPQFDAHRPHATAPIAIEKHTITIAPQPAASRTPPPIERPAPPKKVKAVNIVTQKAKKKVTPRTAKKPKPVKKVAKKKYTKEDFNTIVGSWN